MKRYIPLYDVAFLIVISGLLLIYPDLEIESKSFFTIHIHEK